MSENTNAINSTDARRWVGEILASWKASREIREDAKEKIRPDLEDQAEHRKSLYAAAENAGLPLAALKLEVSRLKDDWECELRKTRREERAGEDTVELADQIKEVLGDFASSPLGQAAVSNAETPRKASSAGRGKGGGGRKGRGVEPDMSAASKASALNVGDEDEADLRGTRQKEREAEATERLKGMKTLPASVN